MMFALYFMMFALFFMMFALFSNGIILRIMPLNYSLHLALSASVPLAVDNVYELLRTYTQLYRINLCLIYFEIIQIEIMATL